jgi:pSer/pThr/pTyr-binding forkhead associated (FHA) protein
MRVVIVSGPDAGSSVKVDRDPFVIGTDASCDLVLHGHGVAARHAAIVSTPVGRAFLEDLGSEHGTFVNGLAVKERTPLKGSDLLAFGDTLAWMAFEEPASAGGDDSSRTVRGRAPGLWLSICSGEDSGKRVFVSQGEFVLGRTEGCDLVLKDDRVSRRHASLTVRPDGRVDVADLDSSNGTFVNGQRLRSGVGFTGASSRPSATLTGRDLLQLGDTLIWASRDEPPNAPVAGELNERKLG